MNKNLCIKSLGAGELHVMQKLKKISVVVIVISLLAFLVFIKKIEYTQINSPDEKYFARVTYNFYQSILPMMPGVGSDKSGYVTIFSKSGKNYGTIPIEMLWMAKEIEWTSTGASIKLVGEWDFVNKQVSYWNKNQTKEIILSI